MIARAHSRSLCIGIALLAWLASIPVTRAESASLEYTIKGIYLYKFIPFVDWPAAALPTPASPVTICIFGHDPFGPGLDQMVANQKESARPVVVRRIATVGEIDQCQELFVDSGDPKAASDLLNAAAGKPILTVTDTGPLPSGQGIIQFAIDANHVRFNIDDASAARNGLVISSKLLGIALSVKPRKEGP